MGVAASLDLLLECEQDKAVLSVSPVAIEIVSCDVSDLQRVHSIGKRCITHREHMYLRAVGEGERPRDPLPNLGCARLKRECEQQSDDPGKPFHHAA